MKLTKLVALFMVLTSGASFAEEVAQTQAANAAGNTLPSMESTTSLQKAVPEATPKSWGAGYLNETRYGRADAFKGAGQAKLDHRFGVTYKLSGGTLGVYQLWRQKADMTGSGASKVTALDPFVRFVFNTIKLNHDWTLDPSVRFYAPTSETSKLNSQNGRFRSTLEFKRPINGRLGFYYAFDGNYYSQKNLSTYKEEGSVANGNVSKPGSGMEGERPGYKYEANRVYDVLNVVGLEYQINSKWSFEQQVGVTNAYTYGDAAHGINHRNEDSLEVWSYLNYAPTESTKIILGLEQSRDSEARAKEPTYSFMADSETVYFLSLSVGI